MTRWLITILLLGSLSLSLMGCSGGEASPNSVPPGLYGTWTLTRIRGGVGGVDVAPDYAETIAFRTNNTATIQRNSDIPASGTFQAKRQATDLQTQPLIVLTLPNGTKRAILSQTQLSLTLAEFDMSDPQQFVYTRQTTP